MIRLFKVLSPKFCLDGPKTTDEIPTARHSPGTSSSSCPGQSQPPADPSRNFSSCRVRKKSSKCGRLNTKRCRQDGRRGKVNSPEPTFLNDRFTVPCGGGRGGGREGSVEHFQGAERRVGGGSTRKSRGEVAVGYAPEGVVLPRPNQIRGRLEGAVRKKGREE